MAATVDRVGGTAVETVRRSWNCGYANPTGAAWYGPRLGEVDMSTVEVLAAALITALTRPGLRERLVDLAGADHTGSARRPWC